MLSLIRYVIVLAILHILIGIGLTNKWFNDVNFNDIFN